jgi:hypothetical protein
VDERQVVDVLVDVREQIRRPPPVWPCRRNAHGEVITRWLLAARTPELAVLRASSNGIDWPSRLASSGL